MRDPEAITRELTALSDPGYRLFQAKLIPTIDKETILGVRVPRLRAYAKGLSPEERAAFLAVLPHTFYDENNLHAFLIERIGGFSDTVDALDSFLPYVDNWATCDMMRPRCLAKEPVRLAEKIELWLDDEHPYTVRFGIGLLLSFFLDLQFSPYFLERVAGIAREEYYIRMMAAWFFATALTKHEAEVLPYLKEKRLDPTVHKMTIRKACESLRLSPEKKSALRSLL